MNILEFFVVVIITVVVVVGISMLETMSQIVTDAGYTATTLFAEIIVVLVMLETVVFALSQVRRG